MKASEKKKQKEEQSMIEEWCLNEGKHYIEELQREAAAIVDVLNKVQIIDPKELQKPCTI